MMIMMKMMGMLMIQMMLNNVFAGTEFTKSYQWMMNWHLLERTANIPTANVGRWPTWSTYNYIIL